MPSTIISSLIAVYLLSSTTSALPTKSDALINDILLDKRAAPVCKLQTLTFDELGSSGGVSRSLPNAGYNYKGLEIRENGWGWVSKGLNYNGDFTADDRPVADPLKGQQTDVVVHSGTNALMNNGDGFGTRSIDAANYSGGKRYYDPKSLWVAPENAGVAFSFKMACEGFKDSDKREKVWAVPILAKGQMYKITIPADWQHMYRCTLGATNLQQIIVDDWEYCLWDFPYSTPPPW